MLGAERNTLCSETLVSDIAFPFLFRICPLLSNCPFCCCISHFVTRTLCVASLSLPIEWTLISQMTGEENKESEEKPMNGSSSQRRPLAIECQIFVS